MATWRVNNSTALGGEVCSQWQANHAYSLGARCVCTVAYATKGARAFVYEVTTAGTSHATTQPTWPTTAGDTVVDGGVTWTARSPSDGSWDNASCILHYVLNHTTIAGGDTVYVDDGHIESGLTLAYTIKGSTTFSNPIKIYCVNKIDETLSSGAIVGNDSGSADTSFRDSLYSYGVMYRTTCDLCISIYDGLVVLESNGSTALDIGVDAAYKNIAKMSIGSQSKLATVVVKNADINLNSAKQYIASSGAGLFYWRGGSLTGTSPTTLFRGGAYGGKYTIEDVDLANLGNNNLYYVAVSVSYQDITLTRCKMPNSYTPSTGTWASPLNGKIRLHHCSSENKYYDLHEASAEGVVEDETTIVRTGGASDGTTSLSYKMVSSAGCVENIIALESPPIHAWTSSTTSKTFTIEGIWDSATNIQNDEIWIELEYPANNTDGLGAVATDKCAILGTPVDQTASTETWTGTGGFSNENRFKLSVTVTPGKAGPITARVYLAKASTTVYIDPLITES